MKFSNIDIERIATRYGRMYVPKADSVIGRSLKLYGEWAEQEISCISECIKTPGAILDIGSNIGTHTLALARRHTDCHVFAFEPSVFTFSLLSASAVFNGIENISLFNLGCAASAGIRFLEVDYEAFDWNYGALSFVGRNLDAGNTRPFSFAPLDDFSFGDQPVVFIKIDVEGMELDVLKGAARYLEKDRPYVFFEVLHMKDGFKCREFLKRFDYKCYWVSTSAYNPDNFNHNPENIWAHGELSILAVPDGQSVPEFLGPEYQVVDDHLNMSVDKLRDDLKLSLRTYAL